MTAGEAKRALIVNADDFGQSFGVNRGIMEAHQRGIVISASPMVRWPAAREAAARMGIELCSFRRAANRVATVRERTQVSSTVCGRSRK